MDQAALHGVLAKVRDLNLPLIMVARSIRTSRYRTSGALIRQPLRTLHSGVNYDGTETIG
jgi:hypothetical protein